MESTPIPPLLPEWNPDEVALWKSIVLSIHHEQSRGHIVVLVTGVFDLFHEEHQNFLQKAKATGDFLVVGVESDVRVRQMKGPGRPVQDQRIRCQQVQSFAAVDQAGVLFTHFDQPSHHTAFIEWLRPDVLAVSSHSPHQSEKQAIVQRFGGTLSVVHQHNPAVSTTQRLQEMK